MVIKGVAFENGPSCKGVSYTSEDAQIDMADIIIDGRYPADGWARNRISGAMVRVLRGAGYLLQYDEQPATTKLEAGDTVSVPADTWYAWSGDMALLMACSPPFDPEQYETRGA